METNTEMETETDVSRRSMKRKKVYAVYKANIMQKTDGLFLQVLISELIIH